MSDPRIANPHPERRVDSIDLEAAETGETIPTFFAVSVEPFDKLRAGSVISPEKPGIK
jgi:hypothetical protein